MMVCHLSNTTIIICQPQPTISLHKCWSIFAYKFMKSFCFLQSCGVYLMDWENMNDLSVKMAKKENYVILQSVWFSDSTADFLDEHRRVLDQRLQPVIREITDSRARTREELESLYRKIVSAVLLRSGLGSPTDIAVVREATGKS